MVDRAWPPLRFVFPTRRCAGHDQQRHADGAWYDIKGMQIADKQDEPGIRDSITQLDELIAREGERGIPAQRVLLAGFSQGGAIALAGGVRHSAKLAGIIALSTYLPLGEKTAAERSDANKGMSIFMGHGSIDNVVPEVLGTTSRNALETLGYAVEWHSYPMAHQVNAQEIADLRKWMTARITPQA